jgi:hypothetical protein
MDWRRILKTALIPAIALVVLQLISFISFSFVGLAIFTLSCLVLLYSGYSAVRQAKLDLLGAALVGAVAGFIATIISSIIAALLSAQVTPNYSMAGILSIWATGLVVWTVIESLAGAFLGGVGALIAKSMEPEGKPAVMVEQKVNKYREGERLLLHFFIVLALGYFFSMLALVRFGIPTPPGDYLRYTAEFGVVAIVPLYISGYLAGKVFKKDKRFALKIYCIAYLLTVFLVSLNLVYGPVSFGGIEPYASPEGYGYSYQYILFSNHAQNVSSGRLFSESAAIGLFIFLSGAIGLKVSKELLK